MTLADTSYSARNNLYVEHTPEQVAVTLMKRGIDGEEVKPAAIYDGLLQKFGDKAPGMPETDNRQNAIRIVRRWIDDAGVKYEGLDSPYEASEIKPEALSYVHRMRIVKRHILNQELTLREAQIAKRVLVEFNDPHGDDVDLIAQYAIVFELAERTAADQEISDIEDLFAFAPWRSNKQSQLYLLARQKGLIKTFAMLRLIAPLNHVGSDKGVPELFIGAHAQLNLPYVWSWVQEWDDKPRDFMVTLRHNKLLKEANLRTDAGFLKEKCDWRDLLEERLNDQPTEQITIAGKQESNND